MTVFKTFLVTLAALTTLAAPTDATAQAVELSTAQQEAVDKAQALGQLLYRYDQAAWHGTDAFLEQFNEARDGEIMRGYIVMAGENDDLLDAIFFADIDGQEYEVARYSVDGGRVVSRTYHEPDQRPVLSPLASRMAASRQTALDAMMEEKIGFCADAIPNTITLAPDDDGAIDVYIMTPPTTNDAYPLGGHYRFTVGADGEVAEWRRFLNSCFDLRMASDDDNDEQPVMMFVSHLLDPQPTEIHFFASLYFPTTLAVGTMDNELAWAIEGGRLTEVFSFGQ